MIAGRKVRFRGTRGALPKRRQTAVPHIIVGTHALLYEGMNFTNLGLAVIDEQHKFGVAQRAKLTSREPARMFLL